MERYRGKKVVIIGGTSGMGLATAKMLLDGGRACSGDGSLEGRPGIGAGKSLERTPSWFRATRVR